jgi:predicted enzyme related to lactoylglutathione lyase
MGKRTEHAPGTFSWVDLSTTDAEGAKSFYADLFGWDLEDMPAGEGMTYTMARVDGDYAAALYEQMDEERSQGVPPHWNSYVTVDSVDEVASRTEELGGTVMMEPFDVLDVGRQTVIQDPTGAVLCAWEPRAMIGAGVVNVPGALTWNELHTGDIDAAISFYTDLFGWSTEAMDTKGGPAYHVIKNGERSNGGIMDVQAGEPPNWLPYFHVSRLEDTISKAEAGGGGKLAGPMPMPSGRIAVLRDPQGAAFALWEGDVQD